MNPTLDVTHEPAVARVIVSVASLEKSLPFYAGVLGLAVIRRGAGAITWLRTEFNLEVLLHERAAVPSDTAVSIGLFIVDLDGVVEVWERQGGTVVTGPATQPWGERMAIVRDPDGHLVCLFER